MRLAWRLALVVLIAAAPWFAVADGLSDGINALNQGRVDDAIYSLDVAAKQRNDAVSSFWLGRALYVKAKGYGPHSSSRGVALEKAEKALRACLSRNPPKDWRQRAEEHLYNVMVEEADWLLEEETVDENATSANAQQALELCEQSLKYGYGRPEAFYVMGKAAHARASMTTENKPKVPDFEKAIKAFMQVEVFKPSDELLQKTRKRLSAVRLDYAQYLADQGQMDSALEQTRLSLEAFPSPRGHFVRGSVFVQVAERTRDKAPRKTALRNAINEFQEAMKQRGTSVAMGIPDALADAVVAWADISIAEGKPDEAIELLKPLIGELSSSGEQTACAKLRIAKASALQAKAKSATGSKRQECMDEAFADLQAALKGEIPTDQAKAAKRALAAILVDRARQQIDSKSHADALGLLAEAEKYARTSAASYWKGYVFRAKSLEAGTAQERWELGKNAWDCFQEAVQRYRTEVTAGHAPEEPYGDLAQEALAGLQKAATAQGGGQPAPATPSAATGQAAFDWSVFASPVDRLQRVMAELGYQGDPLKRSTFACPDRYAENRPLLIFVLLRRRDDGKYELLDKSHSIKLHTSAGAAFDVADAAADNPALEDGVYIVTLGKLPGGQKVGPGDTVWAEYGGRVISDRLEVWADLAVANWYPIVVDEKPTEPVAVAAVAVQPILDERFVGDVFVPGGWQRTDDNATVQNGLLVIARTGPGLGVAEKGVDAATPCVLETRMRLVRWKANHLPMLSLYDGSQPPREIRVTCDAAGWYVDGPTGVQKSAPREEGEWVTIRLLVAPDEMRLYRVDTGDVDPIVIVHRGIARLTKIGFSEGWQDISQIDYVKVLPGR
jgi:tetratricopeptide (TPR) repeat protein